MKILFVASGNSINFCIAPFIFSQGESLRKYGIDISYFTLKGKGLRGYLKNIKELKALIKREKFDLIHAHYSLCGWVSVLGFPGIPVVLSLMGDDAYGEYIRPGRILFRSRFLKLITLTVQPFVKAIISKSENINQHVYLRRKAYIIPNGVSLEEFKNNYKQINHDSAGSKKYVLFLARRDDIRKNFNLARKAVDFINDPDIELLAPYPVSHEDVIKLFNTSDVFLMTTFMEGSPNVIKEAMACNCPIVSTDVGDVKWVIGDTEGCYLTSFDPADVAEKIRLALEFSRTHGRTKGRERIIKLGLDSDSVARRIIEVYKKVLKIED